MGEKAEEKRNKRLVWLYAGFQTESVNFFQNQLGLGLHTFIYIKNLEKKKLSKTSVEGFKLRCSLSWRSNFPRCFEKEKEKLFEKYPWKSLFLVTLKAVSWTSEQLFISNFQNYFWLLIFLGAWKVKGPHEIGSTCLNVRHSTHSLTLHSNFYKYCRISYFQVFPEKLINLDNLVKKNYQFLLEKKLEWTFVCKANVGQNYCFGPNCLQSIKMQGSLISNITWMISNQFHIWHTDKHPKNKESEALTLHKKWSFPLRISSVKVTKSQCPVDLVTFLNTSLMVNFIFCAVLIGYPWSSIAIIQSYCSTYRSETSPQLMVGSF